MTAATIYAETKWNGEQDTRYHDRKDLYTGRNCAVLGSMYNKGVIRARSPTPTLDQNTDS